MLYSDKKRVLRALPDATVGGSVLAVGGNWNNTTNAGLWNWNGNYNPSNANSNIGGRI